jgi:hypothetical protein
MMFIVILDVKSGSGLVRERVEAAIKTMGNWSNRLENGWLLEAKGRGARGIRDHLKQFLGDEDRLFVARISRNWAGRNMGAGFPEWMQRREFGDFPNG